MALFVTPLFCRWWWSLSRIAMPCCTRDSFGERYFGILLIFTHPTVVFDGKGSLILSQEGTTQRNVVVVSWHTSRVDKQKNSALQPRKSQDFCEGGAKAIAEGGGHPFSPIGGGIRLRQKTKSSFLFPALSSSIL